MRGRKNIVGMIRSTEGDCNRKVKELQVHFCVKISTSKVFESIDYGGR